MSCFTRGANFAGTLCASFPVSWATSAPFWTFEDICMECGLRGFLKEENKFFSAMQRFISPEGNFKEHVVWLEQGLVQGFDISPGFGLEIQFYKRILNIWSSH